MADPISIIAIGATVAGGVTTAMGAMQSGDAKSQQALYQANIANVNAQIAKQNADYAVKAGEVEAQQSGLKTKYEVGTTIAQQGAGGLAVGQGSNVQVVEGEKMVGDQDMAIIRSNAAKRAYGYEVEATQATAQGQLDTMAAADAKAAGKIAATASIIGTVGSVASKWTAGSSAGLFSSTGKSQLVEA